MKRLLWGAGWLAVLAALWAGRSLLAFACPSCFGMVPIGAGIHVDTDTTPEQRTLVIAAHRQALARLASFYPQIEGRPRIVACFDWRCYRLFGGSDPVPGKPAPKGTAHGDRYIKLSPASFEKGLASTILAHELAHIELHGRLGLWKTMRVLPSWFDEGLAVVVSQDLRPQYSEAAYRALPAKEQALSLDALQTPGDWQRAFATGQPVYAVAAHHVRQWLAGAANPAARVADLIRRIKAGEPFSRALAASD